MAERLRDVMALPQVVSAIEKVERTSMALAQFQGTMRRARPAKTVRVDYDALHDLLLLSEAELNDAAVTMRDSLDRYFGRPESLQAALSLRGHLKELDQHFHEALRSVAYALDTVGMV